MLVLCGVVRSMRSTNTKVHRWQSLAPARLATQNTWTELLWEAGWACHRPSVIKIRSLRHEVDHLVPSSGEAKKEQHQFSGRVCTVSSLCKVKSMTLTSFVYFTLLLINMLIYDLSEEEHISSKEEVTCFIYTGFLLHQKINSRKKGRSSASGIGKGRTCDWENWHGW